MHPSLIGLGLQEAGGAFVGREAMRTKPARVSAGDNLPAMYDGYIAHNDRVASGRPARTVELDQQTPPDTFGGKLSAFRDSNQYIRSADLGDGTSRVTINPNADVSMLGHELGHVASQNTDVGKFLHNTRNTPALRNSIAKAALLTLPAGALATLVPGDEDIDESIALAAVVSAPAILDELNATRHGLGIMEQAGLKATPGQRMRLAGGALSYIAAPIAAGGLANFAGNLMDDDQQSPGTIQP